jgi:hypothetical protein
MAGDHGRRGHILNEKVSYHERSVQDVQNLDMHRDIDDHDSKSSFKNP